MEKLDVRFVHLPPYRVAAAHAYSAQPEYQAWDALIAWAQPKGLLDPALGARIFGFDNPSPSAGSPNYGYEFWLTVDETVQSEGHIEIKHFPGGFFAVTRVKGVENIFNTWKALVTWCENSPHRMVDNQCLEEHIGSLNIKEKDEELTLDLYLPIAES